MRLIHALCRSHPDAQRRKAHFEGGISVTMPDKIIGKHPRQAAQMALEIARTGDYRHSIKVRTGR